MASPIAPSVVHRILAHISPLEDPLPQNLISKPLFQRHHFLGLTPDDATEYVAWPSSTDKSHVQRLLEGQQLPSHLGDHLNAQYTADSDDLLAHVCISPDLRLVFLWENEDGWQYHDIDTMPFPPNSVEDFNDAYVLYSKNDFLLEQDYEEKTSGADDDSDSYWNSFAQPDDSPHLSVPKASEDPNPEDAYWARYSNIQGSADSTIPSPLPPTKNPNSDVFNNAMELEPYQERVIIPPTEFHVHHVEPYNPLGPPSPAAISRRLQALSSLTLASPLIDECDTPSSYHSEVGPASISNTALSQIPPDDHDHLQTLIQANLTNIYKLWRLNRQSKPAEQDKSVFVDAVQHALESFD